MALNIPMPDLPGTSFLKGLDTGSSMYSRMIQPVLDREKLKQQQEQFLQNLALQKEQEGRQQTLMPYLIQQYQDTHRTAASEAEMKELYRNIIRDAINSGSAPSPMPTTNTPVAPALPPQLGGAQPAAPLATTTPMPGGSPNPTAGLPGNPEQPPAAPPIAPSIPNQDLMQQEHELRAGNPRLSKLDAVAGLIPGIPKPVQHISNGMVFTTYPSGRMTVQQVQGSGGQTPGERNVSAKEASKIREQATALVNSANLVQQGYDLLDQNPDLTGIGSGLASKFNLSNNPELGKFTTVTGKLQAELGKYASQRGGIQAVNWAASVKPSQWKPEDYNYGMFEGIQRNLVDDYNTLNEQYKAATGGKTLPIQLPNMKTARGNKPKGEKGGNNSSGKVTKWKLQGGQLVKE